MLKPSTKALLRAANLARCGRVHVTHGVDIVHGYVSSDIASRAYYHKRMRRSGQKQRVRDAYLEYAGFSG